MSSSPNPESLSSETGALHSIDSGRAIPRCRPMDGGPVQVEAGGQDIGRSATRKITRRVVPFLFASYFMACLDRFNISFAALQMNEDLGLSQTAFGLGAGLFFLSYVAFEIPSNFILARVGARRWIARIMVTWGLVSASMMFIQGPLSFYTLRLLLGISEAGLYPGVLFYVAQWLPVQERAATIAKVTSAFAAAGILGGPLAGMLLTLDGVAGLAGWQCLGAQLH